MKQLHFLAVAVHACCVAACAAPPASIAAPARSQGSTHSSAGVAYVSGAGTAERSSFSGQNSSAPPSAPAQTAVLRSAGTPDLSLPGPALAQLMGVSETEAWLAVEAPVDTPPTTPGAPSAHGFVRYSAVFKLDDGCVSETYPRSPPYSIEEIGSYVAFLDRFPVQYTMGVATRERRYMDVAYGANGHYIATDNDDVRVSLDGGWTFTVLRERAHRVTFVDDRFLVAWAVPGKDEKRQQTLLVYALPELGQPQYVTVPKDYRFEGTEASSLILSHYGTRRSDRCISVLDVNTKSLSLRYCMAGPLRLPNTFFSMTRSPNGMFGLYGTGDFEQTQIHMFDAHTGKSQCTISKHVFGISRGELADDGNYVWQSSSDGLIYTAGQRGNHVVSVSGDFLGLDLARHALVFQRPPLLRPHEVGARMPPVQGKLGNYRCHLLRRVDLP